MKHTSHVTRTQNRALKLFCLIFLCAMARTNNLASYDLPFAIDLGETNILDGGPKVDTPGFYWIQDQNYYHVNKLLDAQGNLLENVQSPHVNAFVFATELLYQSKLSLLGGKFGASLLLPPLVFLGVAPNSLGLRAKNAGLSNPVLSLFIQYDTINYKDRPIFIHRLATTIFPPLGTNSYPAYTINPADMLWCIDTYWAATLYIAPKLAASWHLFYLWCSKNQKTNIKPGVTFHMNYSMAYNISPNCWLAVNGYYLQQLKNSTTCGQAIPESKERVFGIGPGFLWELPKEFQLLGHLYFESNVRNRPQGVAAFLNFIKHF